MAFLRTLVASLILALLLINFIEADVPINGVPTPAPQPIDCGAACAVRCKLSSRPNLCKRACGSCCGKCKCVPPGTAGNYDVCACYAGLVTRNNTRKCP